MFFNVRHAERADRTLTTATPVKIKIDPPISEVGRFSIMML